MCVATESGRRAVALILLLSFIAAAPATRRAERLPYQDPQAAAEKRAEDLLSRMTLEEKVGQLNWPCVYADEVQLYLKHGISSVVTPVKELKGFAKVSLKPGQAMRVDFSVNAEDLSVLDSQLRRVVEPGRFEVQLGASSEDIRLKGSFAVSAE